MSGFFVSNSFGTFQSESETKKFNATITGWGGTTSQGTFADVLDANSPAAPNRTVDHYFKNTTDSGQYTYLPSWTKWSGDRLEFKGANNYGINVSGSNDSSAWYRIQVPPGCKLGGSGNIGPATDDHGWSGSILTAAGNSKFESVKYWPEGATSLAAADPTAVLVELTDPDHYISLDPAAEITGIGTFTIRIPDKDGNLYTFDRNNTNAKKLSRSSVCNATGGTWGTPIYLSLLSWHKYKDGCKESDATNYDSSADRDDGSCAYIPAPITTFTISKVSVTGGANESVSFYWALDSSGRKGISKVTLYANNTDGNNQELATWGPSVFSQNFDYNTSSLPVGTTTFELVAEWDRNPGNPDDSSLSLTVNSPQTLVSCDDPNASKYGESSISGDCGACNSGYYVGTDGLCTNCELSNPDPYRSMNTDGTCGDCLPDYAEHTDGTCQKVGCITYADGTSAEDDYNYDPDAVTNDSSLCEGQGDPDIVPVTTDCGVSDWSDWSEWSDAATSSGTRTRTRTVVTAQSGAGAGCPDLTETETGVVDPNTGEVTITTEGGDDGPAATTETKSLAAPLIIGGIVLTIGYLVMRR